jgi:hypothetical protein
LDTGEIGCDDMESILLAQEQDIWTVIMTFGVYKKQGISRLTDQMLASQVTLLDEVSFAVHITSGCR